jgi:dsDNA-specific endonuclease/ATPase MutS2
LSIELDLDKKMLSEKVFLESIGEELFLIKIEERPMEKINPEELKEKLFERTKLSDFKKQDVKQVRELTIDLHIDELSESLKDNEKLLYQLNEFEKAFDNALLQNVEKLKVIHGIGAGILREKIHKRLSSKKEVNFFEDGDKEKFGFGSTVIYF